MTIKEEHYETHPGIILKQLLAERSISLIKLSKNTGLSYQTITKLTQGKTRFTPRTAVLIAAVLGVSPQCWLIMQNTYDLWQLRHEKLPAPIMEKNNEN